MLEYLQSLISYLPLVIIFYVGSFSEKIYKIHKDFKVDPNISIKLPPNLSKPLFKEKKEEKIKENLNKYLLNFSKVLEQTMPNENLILYRNNKKDVKLNESTTNMLIHSLPYILSFGGLSGGFYSLKNNSVNLYSFDVYRYDSTKTAPYHELFHMASSYYDKKNKIMYYGFNQIQIKNKFFNNSIGIALNEGYTQTLAERYFNFDNKKQKMAFNYELSKNILLILEKLITKEKLENLYMNANLQGLIKELSILTNEEESLTFVQNMDYIFKHYSELQFISEIKNMYYLKIKEIQLFLLKCYIEKVSKEMYINNLDENEIKKFIVEIAKNISNAFKIREKDLNQLSSWEYLDILKENLLNKKIK